MSLLTTFDTANPEVEAETDNQGLSKIKDQDPVSLPELLSSDDSSDGEGDLVLQIGDKANLEPLEDLRVVGPQVSPSSSEGKAFDERDGYAASSLSVAIADQWEDKGGIIRANHILPKLPIPWRSYMQRYDSASTFPLSPTAASHMALLNSPPEQKSDEVIQLEELGVPSLEEEAIVLPMDEGQVRDEQESSDSQDEFSDEDEAEVAQDSRKENTIKSSDVIDLTHKVTKRNIVPYVSPPQQNKQLKNISKSTQFNPVVLGVCAIGIPLVFLLSRYYGDKL